MFHPRRLPFTRLSVGWQYACTLPLGRLCLRSGLSCTAPPHRRQREALLRPEMLFALHFALQFWRWYFRIPIFSLNLAFSTRSLKGLWVIISFSSCGVYLIIFNSSSEELDVYDSSFDVDCSLKFRCCPSSDYSMKMVAKIGRVDVGLGIFNIYRQSSKFIYVSYRSKLNSSLGRPIAFLSN